MAEQVQTGGMMQFRYERQRQAELDPERKYAIETGYAEADDRKKREKRNMIIFWIIIAFVILAILGYIFLRR